jgi:hypothetical protein
MRGNIQALRGKPKEKKKKEQRREKAPVASSSKGSKQQQVKGGGLPNKKQKGKKPISDNDVLTFEQKKDLSEAIAQLDGQKLERVIKIIHEGVPEIKDVSFFVGGFDPRRRDIADAISLNRARRRLSWRLTCCRPRFSRSCTTLYCAHCARLRRNGIERVKAEARAG